MVQKYKVIIKNTFSISGSDNVDYSKVSNENCGIYKEVPIASTELHITTNNVLLKDEESEPGVKVELGPATVNYTDFIAEGWKRVGGKKTQGEHILKAKNIELRPEKDDSFVSVMHFYQLPDII